MITLTSGFSGGSYVENNFYRCGKLGIVKNVIGDYMRTEALRDSKLHDNIAVKTDVKNAV